MSTNTTNISSLIPSEINSTIATIQSPTAFGDQLKNNAIQKIKQGSLSIVDRLKNEIEQTIQKKINLEINHTQKLLDLEKKYKSKPPLLTEEEYNIAITLENKNYEVNKKLLQEEQNDLDKRLLTIVSDPYAKSKDKLKKLKDKLQQRKKRSKKEKDEARKKRLESLKNFAKKDLVPILTLALTEILIKAISQNERLQNLVDQTNEVIDKADTEEKIQQAIILRDNTLKAINEVEQNLLKISEQVTKYQLYINIFSAIVEAILSIPIPTSVPPGIGIPVNFILKLQNILVRAERIIVGLSSVLAVVSPLLQSAIFDLESLKLEINNVNGLIDGKTTNILNNNQLTSLLNSIRSSTKFEDYKGFKFNIKEEQNTQFIVEGNKRHYAVAIDRYGVETLRSDYSFTQDPQVLVNELKLIIDQKNLQG